MDIKIEAFGGDNSQYLQSALNIRFEIYTQELNVNKFTEFDGLDNDSTHYLIFYDMIPAGICRWRKVEDYIYIDRFGIKKEFRNKGLAVLLLKHVVNELILSKKDIILLTTNNSFTFLKLLGFFKIVDVIKLSEIEFFKLQYKKR